MRRPRRRLRIRPARFRSSGRAPAPADRSSLAEEEWNFSRPGNATGGSGKAAAERERGPCPSGKTRGVVVAGRRRGGIAFARRGEGGSRHRVAGRRGETGELWRGKRPRRRADELSEPQGRAGAGAGRRNPGLWETGHRRSRGAMARRGGWAGAVERRAVLRPDVFGNSDSGACSGSPWRRPKRSCLRMANGGDPNSCGDRRRQRGAERERQAGADLPQREIARSPSRQDRRRPEYRHEPERGALGAWRRRGDRPNSPI